MNEPYSINAPDIPKKEPVMFRVKIILLIGAFVFSCFNAIRALIETWLVQDIYSYGYMVPVFSLVWIWHEKENNRRLVIRPALAGGFIVLLIGGLMLVLGQVSGTSILQELAMVVMIPGLVLMISGRRYLAAFSLPLLFLVLMVPLPNGLIDRLHWPFQLAAATIAEKLLNVIHIPVLRSEQFLQLPNSTLEVAEACSGVRFLISTMVLSVPLAFITQKTWVQRALLLLLAILISVIANPLRVTLVTAWAYYGDGDIHGPLHIFQGYVVYVIGMVILFAGAWIFRKTPFLKRERIQKISNARTEDLSDFNNRTNQALTVSLVMLLVLGAYIHLYKSKPVPLKMSFSEIPVALGEWRYTGMENDVLPLSIPGADAEFARVYRDASGREVKVQIAYFESQRQDKKLVYYKLQALYENSEQLAIPKDSNQAVRVTKTMLRDGSQDSLVLSWYDINGRIVASRSMAKTVIAIDGLLHGRNNGAVIIVTSPTTPDAMDMTQRSAISFAQQLLPVLDTIIP